VSGSSVLISTSPQRPDDVVASVRVTTPRQVAQAAGRARAAQPAWAASAAVRSAALTGFAEALSHRSTEAAALVVREVGKPVDEAVGEVARAVSILRYYAAQVFAPLGCVYPSSTRGLLWSERLPHGVAGLVTPWNFPMAIPMWKAAPALAAGNAVLLKPSPESVATALMLAEIANEYLPADLFQVLPGAGPTGAAVVDHSDVVSFTGSVAVGRSVVGAATAAGVPVQAEMGGQNAALVLPDAEPFTVSAHLAAAAFGYAGQKCTATRRIITVGPRPDIVEALLAQLPQFAPTDPAVQGATAGPLITAAARDRMLSGVQAARDAGGRLLGGGEAVDGLGWAVTPAVVSGLPATHPLACEELFAPMVLILEAASLDAAVAMANGVRYGLVSSVHGNDVDALLDAAARLHSGMVKVNAPTTGVDFYAPFGGVKESSHGPREQGTAALEHYSWTRTVTFAPSGRRG
jgi:alpha-ketoglutaric semialdehyde dehydrogenase